MKKFILFIILLSFYVTAFISCDSEESVSFSSATKAESKTTSEQASETVDDGSVTIDASLIDKLELFMPYEDALEILGVEGKRIGSGHWIYEYMLTDGRIVRIEVCAAPKSKISRIEGIYFVSDNEEQPYTSADMDEFLAHILAMNEDTTEGKEPTVYFPKLVSNEYRFLYAVDFEDSYAYYYAPIDQVQEKFVPFEGILVIVSKEDGSFNLSLKQYEITENDGIAYDYPNHCFIINNSGKSIKILMPFDAEHADTIEKMNEYFVFEYLDASGSN